MPKINVNYTQEFSREDWQALVEYGRIAGHDFDNCEERTIVWRLLRERGVSVLTDAREYAREGTAESLRGGLS